MTSPLTVGTAGHVDHGKTALVRALTGVDTDRLPEERARGLTIVLGYAPLSLPSRRCLSVIDVPGHERFVHTMVAGASGIDIFLMVVAADDGVMPQTLEHATVLRALDIERGVVAVTKTDLVEPVRAEEEARALMPNCPVVACSSHTGKGLSDVCAALDMVAARTYSRAGTKDAPLRLHVDRAFVIPGRGTVLTGTLWSGAIMIGASLDLIHPDGRRDQVRVRGLQIHDRQVERAEAGQRVAVNLTGVRTSHAGRGDVLVEPGHARQTQILDCALELDGARHGERVQVHHGTRNVLGRVCQLEGELWQLRLERPLLAFDGDRVVVRRLAPPDTLGGGRVLDAGARRHGARAETLRRLAALRDGHPINEDASPTCQRACGSSAAGSVARARVDVAEYELAGLERDLLRAGTALLSEPQMDDRRAALQELRRRGRAVRVSGRLYAHTDVVTDASRRIVDLLERKGSVTLADARDALGFSRKSTQAFLEHLDAERVTRRMPDNRRVLSRRRP